MAKSPSRAAAILRENSGAGFGAGSSATAKFWLSPEVRLASSYDLSSGELTELARITSENRELFERTWHEYFG
jgi:hypothetical protein